MDEWDDLEEEIATLVIRKGFSLASAIGQVCRDRPTAGVRSLVLASASVAANIDTLLIPKERSIEVELTHYQFVVALAADVAALPMNQESCRDLSQFWQLIGDRLFCS